MISPPSGDSLCSDYVSKKKTSKKVITSFLHKEKKNLSTQVETKPFVELLDVIQTICTKWMFRATPQKKTGWMSIPKTFICHIPKKAKKKVPKQSKSKQVQRHRTPTPTIYPVIFRGFFGGSLARSLFLWKENTRHPWFQPLSLPECHRVAIPWPNPILLPNLLLCFGIIHHHVTRLGPFCLDVFRGFCFSLGFSGEKNIQVRRKIDPTGGT